MILWNGNKKIDHILITLCICRVLDVPNDMESLHSSGPLYIRAHLELDPFGVEPTWT
jgi:hypothetical protein